ncbi:MAG: conjugal transfer protein TraI [Bacteroidetes bacterium]|nr:conjugal transfer protein TraI [Bacteroidota bacterium]
MLAAFHGDAQIPIISVITGAVKKVINALDLQVQRLQNKTIFLQNAQKLLENEMSKLKLDEIAGWVEKQRKLYSDYYDELWKVKQIIMDYGKIKQVVLLQGKIFSEYKKAYTIFQQDKHFSKAEIEYMYKVYSGIMDESVKDAEQLLLATGDLVTQMGDASRLDIIDQAFVTMQKIYNDLRQFNHQNIELSLQRGAQDGDVESVRKLYGLER